MSLRELKDLLGLKGQFILLVSAVSLAICLLTTVYPARKASSLMPVEAIRYIM